MDSAQERARLYSSCPSVVGIAPSIIDSLIKTYFVDPVVVSQIQNEEASLIHSSLSKLVPKYLSR